MEAHNTIEQVARDSWSRLVAFLSARSHDVAAAEDALADAFHAALKTWPQTGIPKKPEAWLLVAARRKLIDVARHARVHEEATPAILAATEQAWEIAEAEVAFPDERLKLLFLCAHPAIDAAARTPLMLQVVLGLNAARIASAFLVKPSAMGQRLARAKTKIRDAGIRFELPQEKELPERLDSVLEAIYAAYGSGWEDVTGGESQYQGLTTEAIELGSLLVQLMPEEPEAKGLLALMLYCEARQKARRTSKGIYIPLSEQDVSLWSKQNIADAEKWLEQASRAGRIGRFQLEAAIQSAHTQRATTGEVDWEAISLLYEGLVHLAPTTGALVSHAAAVAEAHGATMAWKLLASIPSERVQEYQPYWALTAHLLRLLDRPAEAASAYSRAIGLCKDNAMREFLILQAQRSSPSEESEYRHPTQKRVPSKSS